MLFPGSSGESFAVKRRVCHGSAIRGKATGRVNVTASQKCASLLWGQCYRTRNRIRFNDLGKGAVGVAGQWWRYWGHLACPRYSRQYISYPAGLGVLSKVSSDYDGSLTG